MYSSWQKQESRLNTVSRASFKNANLVVSPKKWFLVLILFRFGVAVFLLFSAYICVCSLTYQISFSYHTNDIELHVLIHCQLNRSLSYSFSKNTFSKELYIILYWNFCLFSLHTVNKGSK